MQYFLPKVKCKVAKNLNTQAEYKYLKIVLKEQYMYSVLSYIALLLNIVETLCLNMTLHTKVMSHKDTVLGKLFNIM